MSGNRIEADGRLRRVAGDPDREEALLPTHVPEAHAAFLLTCSNGDLLCTWFAGVGEGKPDGSIYLSRLPAGSDQWSEEVKVSDDPTRSEQNPVLFEAPSGEIWLLYTAQKLGDQATAFVRRRISHDGGRSWGAIEPLFDAPGTFIRQPMIVLSNGEWLLPIFHCLPVTGEDWHGQNDVSAVMISADAGASWSEYAVPDGKGAVHMNVVQRPDGSLLALFRSRYADDILRSDSSDMGRSWSKPVPTGLPNNNSSIQCRALSDGTLALVFNNRAASPEVRAEAKGAPIWGAPRSPMSIALSTDNGESWGHIRDIEVAPGPLLEVNPDKQDRRGKELSYPTVTGSADGKINVAFTYFRKAIKFVRFTPDWVRKA